MMMNEVALAAVFGTYLTILAVLIYFCVVADPTSSRTARFLNVELPTFFWRTLRSSLGRESYATVEYVLDRALLLFYCTIVYGGWSVVFAYIYPWIGRQDYLPHYHRYIGVLFFAAGVASWRTVHVTSPGLITVDTMTCYDHYPYDDLLFTAGQICPTRNIPRLARSKFDRHKYYENVARFDHFCGWVHNTIGEENYRWFLLFLLVHVAMCLYGTYCLSMLFYGEMIAKQLYRATFFDRYSGREVPSSYWILFQYLMQAHFAECSIWLIAAVMSVALSLFTFYHVWLTSRGLTTNESYKWDAIQRWHKSRVQKYRRQQQQQQQQQNNVLGSGGSDNDGLLLVDDPGPAPVNLYNRGIVENWQEVFFPESLRRRRRRPQRTATTSSTSNQTTKEKEDRSSSRPTTSTGSRKAD